MKGARQREPVRTERIFRKTLLASALYAVLSTPHAYAQSTGFTRDSNAFDRTVPRSPNRFDGRMIRAQQRAGRNANVSGGDTKAPAMQSIQQADQTPPARPPRHTVMTADERRLLR
ncbi:hypothetical protein BPUN_0517 [Candidatus Paraburkholderia kirkii]|nr:hypothetical protein BPUN_0517 [Candidatus Paraburkholderia kirkii]